MATNISGVLYLDKTQEAKDNHHDVLVFNLDEYDKKVVLYLGPEVSACNILSFSTHITNILV